MMNYRLTHLTRALSFALLCGWAGVGMVSAEEMQSDSQGALTADGAADDPLPWLRILVEGDRKAAEALIESKLELKFNHSDSGEPVSPVTGLIDLHRALKKSDGNANMKVDRYPMVLKVDSDRDQGSLIDYEILIDSGIEALNLQANSEGADVPAAELRSWRTYDVSSDAEARRILVVLIKQSQYCPLVYVADCDDAVHEDTGVSAEEPAASVGGATEDPVQLNPPAISDELTSTREYNVLERVDYTVKVSLAFAGASLERAPQEASKLEHCTIEFVPLGYTEGVEGDINYRETPPVITATLQALPDASIGRTGAKLRFEGSDCAYNGVQVFIDDIDEMSEDRTMIEGKVVLPAQKPRFYLIYDLSGTLIGDNEHGSGRVIMGFATRVREVLEKALINNSAKYDSLDEYFTSTPSGTDPKRERMSELDEDGSAAPSETRHLHALNKGVRTQMLDRIEKSGVVSISQAIGQASKPELLIPAGESFSTLLDAGNSGARTKNLIVLVQVASDLYGACNEADEWERTLNADFRETTVKRIVAVAASQVTFYDSEQAKETHDRSLIWQCTSKEEDSLVNTWLVSLSDVARDDDWQALEDEIDNLKRELVP